MFIFVEVSSYSSPDRMRDRRKNNLGPMLVWTRLKLGNVSDWELKLEIASSTELSGVDDAKCQRSFNDQFKAKNPQCSQGTLKGGLVGFDWS